MSRLYRSIAATGVLLCGLAAGASAQTLNSIDFNPIAGTSWATATTTPVRLDFGSLGLGSVSFTSVNGGSFGFVQAPFDYNGGGYSPYAGPTTLSDGSIFAPSKEVLFVINKGTGTGLGGFTMTVTLDSGSFGDGSMFSLRSLDSYVGGNAQYFGAGAGLGTPDATQLPTDGNVAGMTDLVYNSTLGLYAGAGPGISRGRAFDITGNSFSATFLNSADITGGIAFTLVTAPVPEPSTYALFLAGLGVLGFVARRRAVR